MIIPECHLDTMVVLRLLRLDRVHHQGGIGQVARAFQRQFANGKALGIIDDDKNKPVYFDGFETIDTAQSLSLRKHPEKQHYLIVVSPAMDNFLLRCANDESVDPFSKPYGFKNRKYFLVQAKSIEVDKNDAMKQLINTLIQKRAEGFLKMHGWIHEILG